MPLHQRPAEARRGCSSSSDRCYLRLRPREDRRDARQPEGPRLPATRPGPGCRSASTTWSSRARRTTLVDAAREEVIEVEQQYPEGAITNGERYNKVIDIWSDVTEKIADEMFTRDGASMDKEGERASTRSTSWPTRAPAARKQQIRQLAGMRGLMAKPSGEIIETPITSNFREGLTVLQYFISTHGARKGLADTALKTADSGYLTRRLVDVAQDVIISEDDCGTLDGIEAQAIVEGGEIIEPLRDRILGRVALENDRRPVHRRGHRRRQRGDHRGPRRRRSQDAGIEKVKIRSVLTCARAAACAPGATAATSPPASWSSIGEAVGVIAAQSIGEPGTQLTMRTFHIGGTASRVAEQSTLEAKQRRHGPVPRPADRRGQKDGDLVVMNRTGSLVVQDAKGRERERYPIVYGARAEGARTAQQVEPGQVLVEWDPYTVVDPHRGRRRRPSSSDIIEGVTVHEEVDEVTGLSRYIIIDSPDEKKQPRDRDPQAPGRQDDRAASTTCPSRAHLMVSDGERSTPGDVLAKIPRETTKTKDITGGLPRVVELFEARKPGAGGHQRDRRRREVRRRSSRARARSSSCPTSRAPSRAST